MRALGTRIGAVCEAGDLILLSGPLGAGKTALTQGIGAAIGIENVTSPTFVISRVHPKGAKGIALVHADAYRLQQDAESTALFDDLDIEDHLSTSVTVIEWGKGLAHRLTDDYLEIDIEFGDSDSERMVTLTPHGKRWAGFTP
jgi:tRNA threonylcarbamoyladenosine biosynthesis protein TsaE